MIASALMAAVMALSLPQGGPETAGEAAGRAVHDVCLGLFDGRPADAARLGAAVRTAGLGGAAPDWRIYDAADGAVSIGWDAATTSCQVRVTGPSGAAADLLEEMTGIGWTELQRGAATGDDTAVDVWTGQPQGVDAPLLVVANRWTSDAEPEDGLRMVLVVLRAQ